MPWMFLDPRRPQTVTPEMREEGVVPYIPELPLPFEAFINYNQTLARVRGIHASPSGLESTCLVLVHGLGKLHFFFKIRVILIVKITKNIVYNT